MSRLIDIQLTAPLLERLSVGRALAHANNAIIVCTIDDEGKPHPAMLSSLEVVAKDAQNLRVATHGSSRTTHNLHVRSALTLVVADSSGVFYIKGHATQVLATLISAPALTVFNVRVTGVLEDNPAAYENARLVSGIHVERGALDSERALAILSELTTVA